MRNNLWHTLFWDLDGTITDPRHGIIDSYIQFIVLKKTLESISFSYRRDGEETFQESLEEVVVLVKEMDCDTPEVKVSVETKTLE